MTTLRRRAGGLSTILGAAALTAACSMFYCSTCFPAGTLVRTPDGAVPIERLEVGDPVLAWDVEKGAAAVASVVATHVHESDPDLLTLTLADGREIRATADHPFWRPEAKSWARADELAVGEALAVFPPEQRETAEERTVARAPLPVKVERITRARNAAPVYNVEVSGPGTFVAADAVVSYY
jgi:intein/homing endonuclease